MVPNCPICNKQIDLHHVISVSPVEDEFFLGDNLEREWWAECSDIDCPGVFYLTEKVNVNWDNATYDLLLTN